MEEKTTRFSYLLSRMGIRGGELAEETGIDKTLVSRWKNGRRKLAPASSHMTKIVDYVLSQKDALPAVERTLQAYGLDDSMGSVSENLAFWLSEQQAPALSLRNIVKGSTNKQYTASYSIFWGEEGLQSAIITMLDYVMTLPGKKEVVIVIRGAYSEIMNAPPFTTMLWGRLEAAFANGVTLTVISRDEFDIDDMAEFSGPWLAAHLRGHVQSLYFTQVEPRIDAKIFAAVKDGIGLRLYRDPVIAEELYIGMYTDQITVGHLYNICQSYRQAASSQIRYKFLSTPGSFLKSADDRSLLSSAAYVCTGVPSFGAIPQGHMHTYTQLTKKEAAHRTNELGPMLQTPDDFNEDARIRHIYCADSVEAALSPGRHRNAALSAAYGKRLNHSVGRLKQQLANIRHWMKTKKNYTAVFLPQRLFEKIAVEFVCIEDHFTVAWLPDGSESTCIKDQNKTGALFGYAESAWEGIPKYCKSQRGQTVRMLDKWIAD